MTASVSDLELAALIADLTTPTTEPVPAPALPAAPCLDPFCSGLPGGGCGWPASEHITHHGAQAVAAALKPGSFVPAQATRSPFTTPARCTVTELLVDACDHCRPKPAPTRRIESGLGPWIAAKYRGECGGCGGQFGEGDRIRAGDSGWLGECCGNLEKPAPSGGLLTGLLSSHTAPPRADKSAGPPASTINTMRIVLTDLDASRPRSQQTALGPSELGTPCQRQIAMKLAGLPRQLPDSRPLWAPMQGTAIHSLMEQALRFHNAALGRERWVIEERLHMDDEIAGSGDAFDLDNDMVVDWKFVGPTALRDVKRKTVANELLVNPDYRVQAHLYGYGHERAGRTVRWVRLVFLARSHNYDDSAEWTEAYNPEIAINALMRYYGTQDLIAALDLANNPNLWDLVPAVPGKACDWCPFRRPGGPADGTGCPGNTQSKIDKQVAGLIA